ncbi:MAG: hypothetical protein ABUT39_02160 [Acidobacteriota bacterium]
MDSLLYYKHSGNYTASGVLLSLGGGAAATVVLSFVYAYVILYCPFIYINFFATLFYGGAVGFVGTTLLKRQKVRNTRMAVVVGLALGLFALYAQWVVWIFALLGRSNIERSLPVLAFDPAVLWSVILEVNEVGAWELKGSAPTGGMLWAIWGLEALLIGGAAVFTALSLMDDEPYCESCNSWCTAESNVAELQTCDPDELKRRMELKDFGYLERLGGRAADASSWLQAGLHKCGRCGMTNTLKVDAVSVTVDKKNKESKSTKTVLDKLLVTQGECATIREIGRKLANPPAAAAKAS